MLAAFAKAINPDDPLSGLEVGERPDPKPDDGWTTVTVKAAALNHHDLWSLKGVGLSEDRLPMILGCDAAGLDEDGNEVVIHAVISNATAPAHSERSSVKSSTRTSMSMLLRRGMLPGPSARTP